MFQHLDLSRAKAIFGGGLRNRASLIQRKKLKFLGNKAGCYSMCSSGGWEDPNALEVTVERE